MGTKISQKVKEVIRTRVARSIGLPVSFVRMEGGGYGVQIEGRVVAVGDKRAPTARICANPETINARFAKLAEKTAAERTTRRATRVAERKAAKAAAKEEATEEAEAVSAEPASPYTQAALEFAEANGFEISDIEGTGPNGKVLLADVSALVLE